MISRTISDDYPLILASASPRRKDLLMQVGLPFTALHSEIEEGNVSGRPEEVACSLAQEKAMWIYETGAEGWILAADTIVVINHVILGKPGDEKDAGGMLRALAGREHQVVTGFSIVSPEGTEVHGEAVTTRVSIKPLTDKEIKRYVNTGEPMGKAGSYAIQGIGAFMVEGITGSYTNVVGLPVCAVIEALKRLGALESFPISPEMHEL
ncbi:MAG: Maf family protein [Desulfatiglandaceae bacterium]|jgi:septum formation protein